MWGRAAGNILIGCKSKRPPEAQRALLVEAREYMALFEFELQSIFSSGRDACTISLQWYRHFPSCYGGQFGYLLFSGMGTCLILIICAVLLSSIHENGLAGA